MHHFLGSTR